MEHFKNLRETFINTADDMAWLLDVHGIAAESAVLYGNEDAPEKVFAYTEKDPLITSPCQEYARDDASGKLVLWPI